MIRAGLRDARQISHCRRHGESSAAAKAIAAIEAIEPRPHQSNGQKCRVHRPRQRHQRLSGRREVTAGAVAQFRKRRIQPSGGLAGKDIVGPNAVAFEEFGRQVKPMPRGVKGKSADEAGHAVSQAGGVRDRACIDAQNLRRQRHHRGRCPLGIALQLGNLRHRLVVEIEAVGIDQILQLAGRQPMPLDDAKQRGGDRMGARLSGPLAAKNVAPPLQADFARQRFTRRLPHPPNLDIESVERK